MDESANKNYDHDLFDTINQFDYHTFSCFLFTLGPYEFSSLAFIMSVLISMKLNVHEQDSLGNWFQLLGQSLSTISSQARLLYPDTVSIEEFNEFKQKLQQKLQSMYNQFRANQSK